MLKLIKGTLVGGADFSEIYIDHGDEDEVNSCSENNNKEGKGENTNKRKVPTLSEIARKVARLQKTQLDEKQYIAYEMIACTFLLGMVNDGRWDDGYGSTYEARVVIGTYAKNTFFGI